MKQKKGFTLREVCGQKVVVAEGLEAINFGKLVTLNETAAWIWMKATELGEFNAEQLADAVCETYPVERDRALQDVISLLSEWQQIGIIED
jgi:predicted transcriptional regulator